MNIAEYWFELSTALVVLGILIYVGVLSRQLKAYKEMATLLKGGTLEQFINELEDKCQAQQAEISQLTQELATLKVDLTSYPHYWHLMRYNAFAQTGSDLSFSLALLNEKAEGFVLTSIFGREDTRVYAKPVRNGESDYTLSDEEKEAIALALKKRTKGKDAVKEK